MWLTCLLNHALVCSNGKHIECIVSAKKHEYDDYTRIMIARLGKAINRAGLECKNAKRQTEEMYHITYAYVYTCDVYIHSTLILPHPPPSGDLWSRCHSGQFPSKSSPEIVVIS